MLSESEKPERDIWRYIDGTMSEAEKKEWDDKIKSVDELQKLYKETIEVINIYSAGVMHEITDPEFKRMIRTATRKHYRFGNFLSGIFNQFKIENESGINVSKIAFGSLLAVAALAVLLFSGKPNQVKKLSSDLFDWEPQSISSNIQEIENGISVMENENMREYIQYNLIEDEWGKDLFMIEKDIEKLLEETKNKSL
ncbi:MAG: hypothetical protein JW995_02840 [Melioribacteraceae bacterium]|nr:hypothetical protein [Melioribacteraceae bacterium]